MEPPFCGAAVVVTAEAVLPVLVPVPVEPAPVSETPAATQAPQAVTQTAAPVDRGARILALKNRLKPYRRLQLQLRNRMGQSLQEHREIVAALQRGAGAAAAQTARQHVLVQGQRFNDLLSLASTALKAPAPLAWSAAATTPGV